MVRVTVKNDRLAEVIRKMKAAKAQMTVGIHADTDSGGRVRDTRGRFMSSGTVSVVLIAGAHEFGAPSVGIPERSFVRSTFDAQESAYSNHMKNIAEAFLGGTTPLRAGLGVLGQVVERDMKQTILDGIPPSLAEATLAKRKRGRGDLPDNDQFGADSTTPLYDTGRLINSIRAVVE